jgi:hypothetical protein
MDARPKIVVALVVAHVPQHSAGNTWAFLNWALAFRDAGWDVWIVEHLDRDQLLLPESGGQSLNEQLWNAVADEFGFAGRATLFIDGDAPSREAFRQFAADARLFVNVSGQFKLHDLVAHIPARLYVDVDPAFTQLWAAVCGVDMNFDAHTHFATVAARLPHALLPDTGRTWIPTLPPVSLAHWSPEALAACTTRLPETVRPEGAWTTVTHWYGYSQIPWEGRTYGNKRDSFEKIVALPRSGHRLLVATDLQPDWPDHAEFAAAGWEFIPSTAVCDDWRVYRQFIGRSAGELGVAKDGYVVSRCGWFSDRSALYLALGRPVAMQDTGWADALPDGDGLRSWSTADEAAETLAAFAAEPERHATAARRIAEEHLAGARVASALARAALG